MDNLNKYEFEKQKSMDSLGGLMLLSFIILPNINYEIPENIKNLMLKHQDNPEALLDNQEIKDFVYSKYNEIKETFNGIENKIS